MEMREFDAANYLNDAEDCRLYLADMMKNGTAIEIQKALADIARAKGGAFVQVDSATQQAFASGTADFATVVEVITALGLRLKVTRK
jgi:probable addiction module antidote protein